MKSIKSCCPTFLANIKVPILEDLIKISSTDKSLGNFFISEISWIEHFIFLGMFSIIVSDFTMFFSRAKAIVKVLKIDPRLLKSGSSGGDSLGKEFMSIEESRSLKSDYLGYKVAPTARSSRAPDLKGTFIKVVGNAGQNLELQHNIHYLLECFFLRIR